MTLQVEIHRERSSKAAPAANKLSVAALTGGQRAPSARFRVRQLVGPLAALGVDVNEYPCWFERDAGMPAGLKRAGAQRWPLVQAAWAGLQALGRMPGFLGARAADVTWIERSLISNCSLFETRLPRPRVLDVDDAIWLSYGFVPKYAGAMDAVIAGNSFIADWFSQFTSEIHIIPTAVDTDRFQPATARRGSGFRVGWSGTAANLKYVYSIEPAILKFLERRPDAHFMILCNRPPQFATIPPERIVYRRWTPANEVDVIRSFDVGLMPLHDGPWERGKCSLKMLQYMACSVPVCVSPVGTNLEIAAKADVGMSPTTNDEWLEALDTLYLHEGMRESMGTAGRRLAEAEYSAAVVAEQVASVIRLVSVGRNSG